VIFITEIARRASYDPDTGETAMTPAANYVNGVYARLASILQRPEVFGLGPEVPQPLADALEGMMQTLGQAFDEDSATSQDDLEDELSQDADRVASQLA
jgi:hypothetical protein